MQVYLVGGAVRDELLGLPVREKDYVVVGATPDELIARGFKPVGKDFPVFLHPETHEEYALARTERKSGKGYKGFTVYASPDVSLEEDLKRRDLTINAMARAADGSIIDPFKGRQDLAKGILRHVSEAFAEDPVRILRVARFAARFGFKVDEGTMQLMRAMVDSGEADALVPERVWQEFSKGLMEEHPERMLAVLKDCGLQQKLLPRIDLSRRHYAGSLPVRYALMTWPLSASETHAINDRLKVPNIVDDVADLAARFRDRLSRGKHTPEELLEILKGTDAFRRPERFGELLEAARMSGVDIVPFERALKAASAVDAGEIAARAPSKAEIGRLVDDARRRAIAAAK
jgi:tRNA nucleotidyltransferase (CCA-adding enzyme)